ncbi:peptidoglycan-associated lipoprotein Pal [Epibacterium sp. Ofav1-8]|jgi:peptidoglycan-associated lipoprotein|uniref:peptidoglycan-associated lipoprotein Pal n=1 Tax=Epibacterium sp. Ofav1-8 TaxID=2917735 RepID=UPI001EF4CE65|nr:peptidoglycan-associated lipoprotein Pal [Epibacterium sp. Ofav1-8]MCG7625664.1 peptidoglycan-associated lipoprotein Pal [Epibacterium sp. Ofav1-8]
MSSINKAILLVAGLALAACSDARWDDTTAGAGGTGLGADGSTADPSSPAYFREAIGDRVLFEVDQSSISVSARSVLDGQARWLNANPDYVVTIEGHADEQGTREYNLALGARRANSAREYLISQGVASSRIQTVSYGKERPIEICSAESCYAQNRRAVTVLAGGAVS